MEERPSGTSYAWPVIINQFHPHAIAGQKELSIIYVGSSLEWLLHVGAYNVEKGKDENSELSLLVSVNPMFRRGSYWGRRSLEQECPV